MKALLLLGRVRYVTKSLVRFGLVVPTALIKVRLLSKVR